MKHQLKPMAVILLSLFTCLLSQSQNIAINTTGNLPDASSILDVTSSNKGLLIPRVSLLSFTDGTTIASPATSLLVYHTNSATLNGKGFYFNNGTTGSPAWTKLTTADTTGIIQSITPGGENIKLERFPMGELYMTGNATATTITNSNTYYKAAGTSTFSAENYQFTNDGVSNRLKYTGTSPKMFHVACTISATSSASNQTMKACLYKYVSASSSWVQLTAGIIQTKLGSTGDVTSTAIHVMACLSTNDYLELRVANANSGGNSFTITEMNLFAMGVSMGMD